MPEARPADGGPTAHLPPGCALSTGPDDRRPLTLQLDHEQVRQYLANGETVAGQSMTTDEASAMGGMCATLAAWIGNDEPELRHVVRLLQQAVTDGRMPSPGQMSRIEVLLSANADRRGPLGGCASRN